MKRLAVWFAGLVFALALVVLVVPFLLPKDAIRQEVVARFEETTGWRLRLDGDVSLSLVPGFGLTAESVGISGAAGADGVEFAKAERIDFGLSWGALFGGRVQLTHIELEGPEILLEIGPDGVTSWAPRRRYAFDDRWSVAGKANEPRVDGGASGESEAPPVARASEGEAPAPFLQRIGVDRLTIDSGTITYADARSGSRHTLEDVDVDLALPTLDGQATLSGVFTYDGIRAETDGELGAPLTLSKGGSSAVELVVKVFEGEFTVAGTVSGAPAADLNIEGRGESSLALLRAAGLAPPVDPGAFAFAAQVEVSPERVTVSSVKADIGEIAATGSARVELGQSVPSFAARLEASGIDLADALVIAGRPEPATGTISADIAVRGAGADQAALLGSLDVNGRIGLQGGTVSGLGLADALGGDEAADRIEDIGVDIVFDGLDKPVSVSGGLAWRGETFTLKGSATPAPMLAGLGAPVNLLLSGDRASMGFEGAASPDGALDGDVSFSTPDLRGLAAWLGRPVGPGGGLKNFRLAGKLAVGAQDIRFSDASFQLDEITGKGDGALALTSPLKVTANLAVDELVLDPYLDQEAAPESGGTKRVTARVPGGDETWSRDPVDFAGLKAVNAALDLTAAGIRLGDIEIGKSSVDLDIAEGILQASLREMAIYGGTGAGEVRLDGTSDVAAVQGMFTLSGLKARPFLNAVADFDWLEGTVSSSIDLSARGKNHAELVSALGGTARFDFANGAILGVNIPKLVRGLTVETLLGWASTEEQKTDFTQLSASFEVANGIARSSDLAMAGPLIRLTGEGSVDLPEKMLDWRFEPKVVPTLQGQPPVPTQKGETRELDGLGVPVVVRGPWAKPRIYPEIDGILEDPQAAYKQLEKLGGGLVEALKAKPEETLADTANRVIQRATGGSTRIDVQDVIEGKVDDQQVLEAVEQGFGLPPGFLGSVGIGKSRAPDDAAAEEPQAEGDSAQ
ncbi:AsmA family protein [Stappia sp. GBMRC 2046]|uniref:AsmA family protein n=1 Tax=Stappia sediminis TaxID=2692190 RepID=A0A7X3LTV5_9HYPH|nr:AsmA family protein [Stappia sediminis]MXN64945.1 AsmA family protein [Stappia sediminis]